MRVCFESIDGEGRIDGEETSRVAAVALTAATKAFRDCRSSLTPLFQQIAEASGPDEG